MRVTVAFPALILVALAAAPVRAFDGKAVSPAASCIAYAPETTAAELQFTTTGIYNPGTTAEKVLCALPHDTETYYSDQNVMQVTVYYRVLSGAPARMTCTLFVGTTSQNSTAVTTATVMGDYASAGGRTAFAIELQTQGLQSTFQPNALMCAIPPKVSLGAITIIESQTDT